MAGSGQAEEPTAGVIALRVEAAPQGLLEYTLDPEGGTRAWHGILVAHDDAVMGAASTPEQTAELLVRGSIECIRQVIPSIEVGGLTMRPEVGPHENAQIVAAGEARFIRAEWKAVTQRGTDIRLE